MEMVMSLVNSLKLNETIFIQFFVFLVGYIFLYYVLFKPYNRAAAERFQRTKGSEESANQYEEEIELLKRKYSEKVKETNLAVKDVYKSYDEKTKKEASAILAEAQTALREEKEKQENEVAKNFQEEKQKVPALAKDIKDELKKVLVGI